MKRNIISACLVLVVLAFGQMNTNKNIKLNDSRLSPRLLNYQGYLTDTLRNPITNPSVSMTFAIYEQEVGGVELWSEIQSVSVDKGIFNVLLGSERPIPDDIFTTHPDRWLELTVDIQTLSPRTRITSVGFAYAAIHSDTALYAHSSAPDNDWSFRVTDAADTTLQTGGRWGLARAGSVLFGTADSTHVNFGGACTTGVAGQNYKYCTVGGGLFNFAGNNYASVLSGIRNRAGGYSGTVAGGFGNIASANYATVSGGGNNVASYDYAVVSGGIGNTSSGQSSFVGGGEVNVAGGIHATVAGGWADSAKAMWSGVGSGYSNLAGDAVTDTAAAVCGGTDNSALARYSYVGGGESNIASGPWSAVVGGESDTASGYYAVVGGGSSNNASGFGSVVAGGSSNTANNTYTFVGSGWGNIASGNYAIVSGGIFNNASGYDAIVSGGQANIASGSSAVVVGGNNNQAIGDFTFIGGGLSDSARAILSGVFSGYSNVSGLSTLDTAAVVCGGKFNRALGKYSFIGSGGSNIISAGYATVAGGQYDTSAAQYSFTVGNNSTVLSGHDNSAAFNGQTSTASGETRVGILSKAAGSFTIDHPLDPEHKILNHYFVESPEMVLIYRGSVVLDAGGRATVDLPDYFDALNTTPMIQLTGVKSNDVWVEEEVVKNTFIIGGKPGIKVYWTVTGARKDPSAEITKILMPVEQIKEGGLAGRSLDDEFLVTTMAQLERMGQSAGFKFRHASEQKRYEEMKQMIQESGARK